MFNLFKAKEEKLAHKLCAHYAEVLAKQRKLTNDDPLYTLKRDKLINDKLDIIDTFSVLRDSYASQGYKITSPKDFRLLRLEGMPGKVFQAKEEVINNYYNQFVYIVYVTPDAITNLNTQVQYTHKPLADYINNAMGYQHNQDQQAIADALQEKYITNVGYYYDSDAMAVLKLLINGLNSCVNRDKFLLDTSTTDYYSNADIFNPYGCSIIQDFAEKNCIDIHLKLKG